MIPARHTKAGSWFFSRYARIQLHRYFRYVRFIGEYREQELPVLLIGNHFSWWDGFIQLRINDLFIKKKFHVMMLEDQLRRYIILNKAGAFSVKKGSRDMLESLNYCSRLLEDPQNLLVIFPQGEIQSLYTRYFRFEKGIERITKIAEGSAQLLFNVNLTDYFSHKKPGLNVYFRTCPLSDNSTLPEIEEAYNEYVKACIKQQQEA